MIKKGFLMQKITQLDSVDEINAFLIMKFKKVNLNNMYFLDCYTHFDDHLNDVKKYSYIYLENQEITYFIVNSSISYNKEIKSLSITKNKETLKKEYLNTEIANNLEIIEKKLLAYSKLKYF